MRCHAFNDFGGNAGPRLNGVAARLTPDELLRTFDLLPVGVRGLILAAVIAAMEACGQDLVDLATEVESAHRVLHDGWAGLASDAHTSSHEGWRTSFADMTTALAGLRSLGDVARFAERVALISDRETFTYAELNARANRYARWYERHPREKAPAMESAPAEVTRARGPREVAT